jgi:hypothetical protein
MQDEKRSSADGNLAEPRTRNTWLALVVAVVVAVLQGDGLAETDRHGTTGLKRLEHFYVRESVCARVRCHNICFFCKPGKDGRLARRGEVE